MSVISNNISNLARASGTLGRGLHKPLPRVPDAWAIICPVSLHLYVKGYLQLIFFCKYIFGVLQDLK